MGLDGMTDAELQLFARTQNQKIADNPEFSEPAPTVADMADDIDEFTELKLQLEAAKLLVKQLTQAKNQSRKNLENRLRMRAAYVQLTSNGNTARILSAGFDVRDRARPVGELPPPELLQVELSDAIGQMELTWRPVEDARTYLVQQAEVVDGQRSDWTLIKVSGKSRLTLSGMTVGRLYLFRVAAGGGRTGRSDWSTEVMRYAA